jgi:hypothetical protein
MGMVFFFFRLVFFFLEGPDAEGIFFADATFLFFIAMARKYEGVILKGASNNQYFVAFTLANPFKTRAGS